MLLEGERHAPELALAAEARDHREDADVELSDKARALHGHFMGGAALHFAFGGRRTGAPRRGH